MLTIPLILIAFPARYSHSGYFWGIIGWYGLAKGLELLDREIFALNGVVTGHNLKHLAAAAATGRVLLMLRRRRPLSETAKQP